MQNLTSSGFTADILGKKRNIKFEVRNFIALKKRFNIETYDLIDRVLKGDEEAILIMIWCGTLVFADKFDLSNPTQIKEEIDIEKLYKLEIGELREIGTNVVKGLLDSMPEDTTKKKDESDRNSETNKENSKYKINWNQLFYIFVSVMGFSEEFYFKSECKRLFTILEVRNEYYKDAGASVDSENEAKALQRLDSFLG